MTRFLRACTTIAIIGLPLTLKAQQVPELDKVPAESETDRPKKRKTDPTRWGIAAHLPKDTSYFVNLHEVPRHFEEFCDSGFGRAIDILLKREGGSLKKLRYNEGYKTFNTLMKDEFFMSIGGGSDAFWDTGEGFIESFNETYGLAGTATMFHVMHQNFGQVDDMQEMIVNTFLSHKKFNPEALKEFEVVPITIGFKVKSKAEREALKSSISEGLRTMQLQQPEFIKKYSGRRYKKQHVGVKIQLGKMMDAFNAVIQPMVDQGHVLLDIEKLKKLAESQRGKNLFITVGEYKDYLILYAGHSMGGLRFTKSSSESLLMSDKLSYVDKNASGELVMHAYVSEALSSKTGGVLDTYLTYGAGALKFLKSQGELFGDCKTLEQEFNKLRESHKKFEAVFEHSRSGMVLTREKGLQLKVYGGSRIKDINVSEPNSFGKLPISDTTIFSAHWSGSDELNKHYTTMLNQLVSCGKQVLTTFRQGSEKMDNNEDFLQGIEDILKYEVPVTSLIETYTDIVTKGLGRNRAVIIDGGGEFPSLPQIPDTIVRKGKVPRVVFFADVKSHEVLSQSWEKAEDAIWDLTNQIGKENGFDLPAQRVDKIESAGGLWYSYSLPGTHQNCKPSLGIKGDTWMLTTSPDYAKELLKSENPTETTNFSMLLKCNALSDLLIEWIALLDEEEIEIFGDVSNGYYKQDVRPVLIECTEALLGIDTVKLDVKDEDGDRCLTVKLTTQEDTE